MVWGRKQLHQTFVKCTNACFLGTKVGIPVANDVQGAVMCFSGCQVADLEDQVEHFDPPCDLWSTVWSTLCEFNIGIENGHRNSGYTQSSWWFSKVMLNYQRVIVKVVNSKGLQFLGDLKPQSQSSMAIRKAKLGDGWGPNRHHGWYIWCARLHVWEKEVMVFSLFDESQYPQVN